ncbi:hypothetical protein [Leifsonia xyli]|uniref:hypothetical protein n=1 Tax=Leifsonia xyli TaxID=1575 RepID=UPI003D671FB1
MHPSTGYVLVIASGRTTLIDANTGEDVWTLGPDGCFGRAITKYGTNPTVDAQATTLMIAGDGVLCRVGLTNGDQLPAVRFDQPLSGMPFFGSTQFYTSSYRDRGGDVEAYDLGSGERVWTQRLGTREGLMFLGGTLVRQAGDHIESLG